MFKQLNIRGASHHFLLPVLAVLLVAGIGGYIMQRGSDAATPPCVQRTFSTKINKSSVCVSHIINLMKASGKAPLAKPLSGTTFGTNTRDAVKQFQKQWTSNPDGVVTKNGKTWSRLCSQGKSGNRTAWTKAGCGGANTTTTKTGWTNLGLAGAGYPSSMRINFKVTACKIAVSNSGMFKVKVNIKKGAITYPTKYWDSLDRAHISVYNSASRAKLGVIDFYPWNLTSKTFTTSKTLSSGSSFSVEGNSQFKWLNKDGGLSTRTTKISNILLCN